MTDEADKPENRAHLILAIVRTVAVTLIAIASLASCGYLSDISQKSFLICLNTSIATAARDWCIR